MGVESALPADRAWGGSEGSARVARGGATMRSESAARLLMPFAGTTSFAFPMTTTNSTSLNPGSTGWPPTSAFTFTGTTLTAVISDLNGHALQTLSVNLPAFSTSVHNLTPSGECTQADGSTPATSQTGWTTNAGCRVAPSWYMNFNNRLLATQLNRGVLIQAGDLSRSVQANTDMRVLAGLTSVSTNFFSKLPTYSTAPVNAQGGSHADNNPFCRWYWCLLRTL